MRRGRPKCLIRKSCVSILDGNLISSLSDGRSDPPGLRNQIWQGSPSCLFEGSEHLYRIKTLLDPGFFFFNPGSVPLSYCRLKLESYLFFSYGNMFAVTLMLRNQIKIAPSLKMWGRRNRNTNFWKVGASRTIQGEGHSQNSDKGGRTKASYCAWRPASRFPNNPHKDSILQRRRVITHKTPNWPGQGQGQDLRLGGRALDSAL